MSLAGSPPAPARPFGAGTVTLAKHGATEPLPGYRDVKPMVYTGLFPIDGADGSVQGIALFPEHKTLLGYEKLGTSKRYSYYALPEGCSTVFFPGCGLPGTRPKRTLQVFNHLRRSIPDLGIVLDCCAKPSHDLGREDFFNFLFGEMRDYLLRNGVRTVLTACPNCFRVFKEYGSGLSVRTAYEVLAEQGPPANPTPRR